MGGKSTEQSCSAKGIEAIATCEEFLRIFPNNNEATAVRSFIVQLKKDMND